MSFWACSNAAFKFASVKLSAFALTSLALDCRGVCGAFRLRGCLVSGLDETFEGLAGLFDALRGQVTDFGGDFVGDLGHGLHPSLKFEARRRTEFADEPSHC
jgi:hypothetical protein